MEASAPRKGAVPFTNYDGSDYTSLGNQGLPVSTPPDVSYYKMDRPKQGLALIFNHELYAHNYVQSRDGTNRDCDALSTCFKRFGFEVRDYQNLKLETIEEVLAAVAGMDHTDYNCLVVAVLTHGDPGVLCAYDKPYRADIIWSSFTAKKCPSLKNKPKMFFIQACQGSKTDAGVTLTVGPSSVAAVRQRTRTDGRGEKNFRIRSYADFLIAYSTIPGYYSWRRPSMGSWFIRALCEALNEYGTQFDLLTILTFVCRRVAVDFESNYPDDPSMHKKKQSPYITSMLTHLVRFA